MRFWLAISGSDEKLTAYGGLHWPLYTQKGNEANVWKYGPLENCHISLTFRLYSFKLILLNREKTSNPFPDIFASKSAI